MSKDKVIPEHKYKITFGVKQTEKISAAANIVNETPLDFMKNAVKTAIEDCENGMNILNIKPK